MYRSIEIRYSVDHASEDSSSVTLEGNAINQNSLKGNLTVRCQLHADNSDDGMVDVVNGGGYTNG